MEKERKKASIFQLKDSYFKKYFMYEDRKKIIEDSELINKIFSEEDYGENSVEDLFDITPVTSSQVYGLLKENGWKMPEIPTPVMCFVYDENKDLGVFEDFFLEEFLYQRKNPEPKKKDYMTKV